MEIASTSRALHLFPTSEQRFKIKRGLGFSEISSTQSCRVRKVEEERYHHVLPAPKKRNKLSEEEEAANKRQKTTIEQDLTTTKVCSVSQNPNDGFFLNSGKRSRSKPITALKSITLPRIRLHQGTKIEKPKKVIITKPIDEEVSSLRDLIAKAKNKVEEKRKIDGRREYLARKRLLARLAINQIVPTVDFDDHLKYHHELLQLGCTFIQDQVNCLTKFSLLSRDSYYIEESTTSAASEEETKLLLPSGGEIRKHGSAESTNQGNSNNPMIMERYSKAETQIFEEEGA